MDSTTLHTLAHTAQAALDAHRALKSGPKATAHARMAKAHARTIAQQALDALTPVLFALIPTFLDVTTQPMLRVSSTGATVSLSWGHRGDRATTPFKAERFVALVGAVDALTRAPIGSVGKSWRKAEGDATAPFAFFGPFATLLSYNGVTAHSVSQRLSMRNTDHIVGQGQDPWDALRWLVLTRLVLAVPRADELRVAAQRNWDEGAAWALSLLPKRIPLWSALPALIHRLPPMDGLDRGILTQAVCSALCVHLANRGVPSYQEAVRVGDSLLREALAIADRPPVATMDCLLVRPQTSEVYAAQVDPNRFFARELAKATPTMMAGVDTDWKRTWSLRAVGATLDVFD